jgi:hypothetical protein
MRGKASPRQEDAVAGKHIGTNLELRLKGWTAAVKSSKTPMTLRRAIRANIRELRKRLKKKA